MLDAQADSLLYKRDEQAMHHRRERGFVILRALGVPLDADDPAMLAALHALDQFGAVLVGVGDGSQAARESNSLYGLMVA